MKKLFSIVTSFLLFSSLFSNWVLALTWTIEYSPSSLTNTDVTATITGFDEPGTVILNNGGSPIYNFTNNGSFIFQLSGDTTTDNATATVSRIDKQAPQVTNITDGEYSNTNITPIITDANYSGATLNGNEYTGTEISNEGIYALFVEDLIGNNQTINFTIDKTAPTASIEYSHTGWTNQDVTAIITGFSETITDLNSTGTIFTTNGTYTFTYQDLAGNLGVTIAEVTGIDKTPPTGTIDYSTTLPINGDVEAIITGFAEEITGLNQTGYLFTADGTFLFTYEDLAGNTGETLATVNRIDKENPNFNGVTTGGSYGSTQTIIFSDNKPGVIATLNGAGYNSGDPINGYGTFEFLATDTAGNTSGATFTLDTTSPVVTLNGSSPVYLEVFSTYSEDGAIWSDNGSSGPITNIVGSVNTNIIGTYVLDYFYTDTLHTGSVQRQVIIQDTTAPIITLNGSNPTTIERTTAYIEDGAIWSDNYDGTGDVSTILGSVNTDLAGTYILTYQKTDSSANAGSTTRTVNVIDTIAPTASTILYSTTGITNQDVTATVTGFSESITNLNTSTHTFTGNGSFTFTFEDLSGNTGELIATVTRIDKTPPTASTIDYSITGLTNQDVIATITGFSEEVTGRNTLDYTFTENNTFLFTFEDLAGNTGELEAEVTRIDKTPPTASTINYSITGLTNQDVIATITGFSEEITGRNTLDYIFTGNNTFLFTFEDLAGNTGELEAEVTRIDKTPITASIVYIKDTLTNEDVIATITGFNKTGITINGSNTYTFTGNGTHIFEYEDLAGNTGESLASVTWIDKTMPTASLRYDPLGPSWTNGSVFVQITGFSETITGLNQPDYLFLTNGTFVFTYRDLAGNTGTNTATVNRIDITPPTVGQSYISAGMTGNNGVTLYYNGAINIRSNVSDAGGSTLDGSTCEYTFDGITRNPAGFNTTYCELTSISPATNIQIAFRIKDTATNLTTGASTSYIYDITAPVTTATPNSGTSNTSIPVTLSRTDSGIGTFSGTRYCIDTTDTCTPNIAGTTATITGATNSLETKYLRYRSIDRLNNTESIKSNIYTIDKVLPGITGATSYSNNSTNTGYATTSNIIIIGFSSTRTLATLPTVTISGGSLTTGTVTDLGGNNYSASYTAKVTDTQGQMKFIVNLQDTLGNTGSAIINSVILDRTAPAGIAFTAPTAGTFWTSGANYDIKRSTGTETNFGPTSIKIIYSVNSFLGYSVLDNGTGNSGTYTRNNFNLNTNNLQIRIIATDLAGNQTTVTSSTFGVDNTPPVAPTFIYPVGGEYIKGGSGYLVTWTGGYDPDGNMSSITLEYSTNNGVTYTVISAAIPTSSTSYLRTPSTALNSNTAKLRITYKDYAGLQALRQTPTVFTLDGIRPTITNVISGRIYTGSVSPIITDTNYSGSILTNGSNTTVYTTTGFTLTQDGIYSLIAEDRANNTTGISFTIDTTAPTIQINTGTIYQNSTFTAIATGIDATAGISGYQRSKISGPGIITFGSATSNQTTISADTDGTYIIQVKATDRANFSGIATFTLVRDSQAPITNTVSGTIYTGSVNVNITDSNYSRSVVTDSEDMTTYLTTGFSLTGDGLYSLYIEDFAGNITEQTFTIDTTAPTIQMETGTIYQNTGFTITATGTDSTAGISGYERSQLSGTGTITFGSATGNQTTITANTGSTYVIQFKATDKVNLSKTATFTLVRDTQAPTLSSGSVSVTNQTATFSFYSNKTGTIIYSGACGNGTATTAANSGVTSTSWTLANATYNNCSLKVTDSTNNYSRINVPSFTINYTAPTGGGGGGGGGGGSTTTTIATCELSDLACEDGKYVKKSGVSCQGGFVGYSCGETTTETTTSSEDILSSASTENIAATLVGIQGVTEFKKAYIYAKYLGLTNASTFEQANMNGVITRSSLAKMMSIFAIKILKKQPDTSKKCEFNDISNETKETQEYIKTACQLGIMGVDKDGNPLPSFFGTKTINRATFGTTLSRTLWGSKNNSNDANRYAKHLEALQKNGIMKQIDKPDNRELKGYIMLMMFRTDLQLISKVVVPTTTSSTSSTNNTTTNNSESTSQTSSTSTTNVIASDSVAIQTTITRTDTEQSFINNINKNYQFTVGFKKDATDVSIKYLQYFLKSKGFYQGVINGTNTESTIKALFERQKANNILSDSTDPAAGYLGPKTRETLNPLLKQLLNS